LRYQVIGNKVAELPQERELSPRWLALRLIFHTPPCGRIQTRKPTLFQPSTIKPVIRQWDVLIVFNADKYQDILITEDKHILTKREQLSTLLGIRWIMKDFEAVAFVRKLIGHRDDAAKCVSRLTGADLPVWVGRG